MSRYEGEGDSATKICIGDFTRKEEVGKSCSYPQALYCPITKELFRDPVVAPDGLSYERVAKEQQGDVPSNKLYPNRALQSIIAEVTAIEEANPLPDALHCPITFHLIHVPVIDSEGNTYERVAIESWLRANGNQSCSPMTRNSLQIDDLYPNWNVLRFLEEVAQMSLDSAVQKWKEEDPPTSFEITSPTLTYLNIHAHRHDAEARASRVKVAVTVIVCCIIVSPYWLRSLWNDEDSTDVY